MCVVGKETYFTVLREGHYYIERIDPNLYTDHAVIKDGVFPDSHNVVHGLDNVIFNTSNVIWTNTSTGTPVTDIITNYSDAFVNTRFKVIADFSIMPDAKYEGTDKDNKFTITRDAYRIEVGLNFETNIVTLPINQSTQSGQSFFKRKRVVKVDISVQDTLGVQANDLTAPDRSFIVVLDDAPELYTGFREMYLLGYIDYHRYKYHKSSHCLSL